MQTAIQRYVIALALLLFPAIYSFGQRSTHVTLYQNTDMYTVHYYGSGRWTAEGKFHVGRLSLAVDWQTKKGLIQELELLIPEFSKPADKVQFPMEYRFFSPDNHETEADAFSLRYHLYKPLPGQSDPLQFYIGAGINPYYVHAEFTPVTSNSYYTSQKLYGFALNATPGLYYTLGERFELNLNVPVRLYNFRGLKYRQDNPILPLRQQRYNRFKHLFFEPVYTIRLGLRYNLGK